MAVIRGQSYTVLFYVWNTADGTPKTGDATNITVRISKNGGPMSTTSDMPAELDSTNAPGWYTVMLTDSEMNADSILVVPQSATSGVMCQQILILTEKGRIDVNVSTRSAPGDAMTLTSAERSSIANAVWSATTRTLTSFGSLVSDVAQAVWAHTIEASQSALAWMRLIGSVLFGKRVVSGNTVAHRDWSDTKDRVVGVLDTDKNRNITTRDGS